MSQFSILRLISKARNTTLLWKSRDIHAPVSLPQTNWVCPENSTRINKVLRDQINNKNETNRALHEGLNHSSSKITAYPDHFHNFEAFESFDRPMPNINNETIGELLTVKPKGSREKSEAFPKQ